MAFSQTPLQKMSLVAQYDDLCRYTKYLTSGSEEEFKVFVLNQLNNMKKQKEAEAKVKELNAKISNLLQVNKKLETQIGHLKNLVQEGVNKRRQIESEKKSLETQIELIKDVLLADGAMDNQTKEKLGFLNAYKGSLNSSPRLETIQESVGSLLSLSDIDRTEEDFDPPRHSSRSNAVHQSKDKRSNSESRISPKRTKFEGEDEEEFVSDVNENNLPIKATTVRSSSEPAGSSFDSPQLRNPPYGLRRCNTDGFSKGTSVTRYSTGGKLSRIHSFVIKTLYRPEKCQPCQHNIGFLKQSLKCQDCRVICHPECKEQCPLPCIPIVNTPTKNTVGLIGDYTSSTPPMIPPLIVYCVNEIESRGLKEIGLYRVPGSERKVKVLKEKFLNGRTIPCLIEVDLHTLCGTIKEFLRSLKEPLVTLSAWQEFANAADLPDKSLSLNAIYDIVADLPQPNRDTLTFLLLHLQRVANSPDCKMPISSLAKMLGPTIIGYSVQEPSDVKMFSETDNQYKIMERLLSIPAETWKNLLNVEYDVFMGNGIKTPENIPAPRGTRLGPLYANGQTPKNSSRTPLTARGSNRTGKIFSSPRTK